MCDQMQHQIGKRGPTQRSSRASTRAQTSGGPASCLEKLDVRPLIATPLAMITHAEVSKAAVQTNALARYCLRFNLTTGDVRTLSRNELLEAAKAHFIAMVRAALFRCAWDMDSYEHTVLLVCLQEVDEQSTVQEFVVTVRQQLHDGYKKYEMELRDHPS